MVASFKPADIVPGRLAWSSKGRKIAPSDPHANYFCLSTANITAQAFNSGVFRVMHYDRRSLGNAFGPLSLIQAACFSEELTMALKRNGPVIVQHPPSIEDRVNTAVLIGYHLIVREGWTVEELSRVLPAEARVRFPCQWDRSTKCQEPVMSVEDCWAGLHLAKQLGWLRTFSGDPIGMSLSISQQLRTLAEYDAAWMIPDKVLVMADPMTTIRDPNPATCSCFHRAGRQIEADLDRDIDSRSMDGAQGNNHKRQVTEETCDTSNADSDARSTGGLMNPCGVPEWNVFPEKINTGSTTLRNGESSPQAAAEDGSSKDSVASVCKRDHQESSCTSQTRCPNEIPDFITFCQINRIATVVRTNSGEEEGLVEDGGSYQPFQVTRHGIQHVDLFVNDTRGSLPTVEVIRQFIETAHAIGLFKESKKKGVSDKSPALLVHCKSGFGRSVLLACCLIILAYDVPGRALLGWARLVRPGAITVREQEMFLCRFGGRADLERLLEEDSRPAEGGAARILTCQPCCEVQ